MAELKPTLPVAVRGTILQRAVFAFIYSVVLPVATILRALDPQNQTYHVLACHCDLQGGVNEVRASNVSAGKLMQNKLRKKATLGFISKSTVEKGSKSSTFQKRTPAAALV